MAQIIYEEQLFNSRSDLVRALLLKKTMNKSTIAVEASVAPTTVEYLYKQMVKQGKIDDYYAKFIEDRKQKRLNRRRK
jgi:uncharacterized protein (UPF0332 family)|tara:strand:- start:1650 stop:1883 length:234 start_codon:yes stop_codon:yes gene_type:complete